MKNQIALLGSTGSIGTQTLQVLQQFPDQFAVVALAAGNNIDLLAKQIEQWQPQYVSIANQTDIPKLSTLLGDYPGKIVCGTEGLEHLAGLPEVDTVVVGLVGLTGLAPTLCALQAGKKVLTANKETFVTGGHLVQPYLSQIVPIDSEHSAIYQSLAGTPVHQVKSIILTASGGPFRGYAAEQLNKVTLAQALKHPNWTMGQKVTIDSATLMNKGLEVIEAHWLFGVDFDQIQIVIHPQSVIHSGVEFIDHSVVVQLGQHDMRVPIQYALGQALPSPQRLPMADLSTRMNWLELGQFDFDAPDFSLFPCARLAYEAGRLGPGACVVLNAADEVAVDLFLQEKIQYPQIAQLLEAALQPYIKEAFTEAVQKHPNLSEIYMLDGWARQCVANLLQAETRMLSVFAPKTP